MKKYIILSALILVFITPNLASAATLANLEVRIINLEMRVKSLETQLKSFLKLGKIHTKRKKTSETPGSSSQSYTVQSIAGKKGV